MTRPRARATWIVPVVLVAVAAIVTAVVVSTRGDDDGGSGGSGRGGAGGATTSTTALAVESDSPTHATLDELVAASDVVLRGTVVAAERGRWFGSGEAGAPRIESRLITVQVDAVLAGSAPADDAVLVEEEGWLEDGTPIIVDGTPAVEVGDEAVWFLLDGGDPDLGAYVVVNGQGRYLVGDDGTLTGATGGDPVVREVVALDLDALAAAIGDGS